MARSSGNLNSHGSELPVAIIKSASKEALVVVGQSVVVVVVNVEAGETVSNLVLVSPSHGGLVTELDESAGVGVDHLASVRELGLEGVVSVVARDHQSAVVVDDSLVVPLVTVDTESGVLVLGSAVHSVTVEGDSNGVGTRLRASEDLIGVIVRSLVVRDVVSSAVGVNGASLELLLAVVVLPGDSVVVVESLVANGVGSSIRQGQSTIVNTNVPVLSVIGGVVVVDNVQITLDVDKDVDGLERVTVDILVLAKVQVSSVGLHGQVSVVPVSLGVHLVHVVRVGPLVVGLVKVPGGVLVIPVVTVVPGRVVIPVVTIVVTVVVVGQSSGNESEGGDREFHGGRVGWLSESMSMSMGR